jgi:hypothetical protein
VRVDLDRPAGRLFKLGQDLIGALDDGGGQAGQLGNMDAVGTVGTAGDDLVQEDDFSTIGFP